MITKHLKFTSIRCSELQGLHVFHTHVTHNVTETYSSAGYQPRVLDKMLVTGFDLYAHEMKTGVLPVIKCLCIS